MKKYRLLLATLIIGAISLTGCSSGNVPKYGEAAGVAQIDRSVYLAQKTSDLTDITSVVAFVDTMRKVLGENILPNYTTSYDSKSNTVYVNSNDGGMAFKLDDQGNVMFASACGSASTKAKLSQGIATVCVGTGISSQVNNLFNKAQETQWLNSLNSNLIQTAASTTNNLSSDMVLLTVETPNLGFTEESDLEKALNDSGLQMPVLTDKLTEYGIDDLSDYYESPSLEKFWSNSTYDIQSDIDTITSTGESVKDVYNSLLVADQTSLELPDWNISGYSLPSQFSDGTSTELGSETLSAFNDFQSTLSSTRDELWAKQSEQQDENNAVLVADNTAANEEISNKILANYGALDQTAKDNQASINDKNTSASQTTGNFGTTASSTVGNYTSQHTTTTVSTSLPDYSSTISQKQSEYADKTTSNTTNQETAQNQYETDTATVKTVVETPGKVASTVKDTIINSRLKNMDMD